MRIVFDGRALDLYHLGQEGFHGGTELMVKRIAHGLAERGHTVHVVTNDLPVEEQRGRTEWWWGPQSFPRAADMVVLVHSMENLPSSGYTTPLLVVATNGIDPPLIDDKATQLVDAWPVFSECHRDLLCKTRPAVDPEKCFVTGLGVDLAGYNGNLYQRKREAVAYKDRSRAESEPGRLLYANDPARGLWHVLDIFDKLKALAPHATLHVSYDFPRAFENVSWNATAQAQAFWDMKRRLETTPGVVSLGALSRTEVIREQLECQVHAMPSDPPNVGSQIHGITQMECAAAGAALVLSDIEAFPEVFGSAATILPLPGTYLPDQQRRLDPQDWAETIADIMNNPDAWDAHSAASRRLAEKNTWNDVVDRWENMIGVLMEPQREVALAVPAD